MSNSTKMFLTVLVTYLIIHLGYWLSKFNPRKDLRFWPGLVVDFSIWVIVFFVVHWAISKMIAPKTIQQ